MAFIQTKNLTLEFSINQNRPGYFKETIIEALSFKSKKRNYKETIKPIHNLDLTLKDGDRLGIIGMNGAGKSSLLKVLANILPPSSGSVDVRGRVQPLIEIGAGFDPEFSGRENIYLNGYMMGFTKKQIKEKENEIIEFSELKEFIDTPIKYYSSGMSVRLAFTIATMVDPEILLIDEMLSAGDASFIIKAKKRLSLLVNKAKIIVLVSHDMQIIESMCNRVIVLDHGDKVFDGPTSLGLHTYNQIISSHTGTL